MSADEAVLVRDNLLLDGFYVDDKKTSPKQVPSDEVRGSAVVVSAFSILHSVYSHAPACAFRPTVNQDD